jgi:hypothetical protein
MFSARLLSSIYCAVLLVKGYQAGLLLLPAARQQQAHKRATCGPRVICCVCASSLCVSLSVTGQPQTSSLFDQPWLFNVCPAAAAAAVLHAKVLGMVLLHYKPSHALHTMRNVHPHYNAAV